MDRPWPPPVPRVWKAPAHCDEAPLTLLGIPNDHRQRAAYAIGNDFIVAAFAVWRVATTAFRERLRERNNFTPRRQGRELPAHGGTLSSPPAVALSSIPRHAAPWAKTCSSSCLSSLHLLRSWSLRQTRGGSIPARLRHVHHALERHDRQRSRELRYAPLISRFQTSARKQVLAPRTQV
jgi:hypothetical protein